jgi:hypothetical protein
MILLADETLYDMWIDLDIDILYLEKIQDKLSRIFATNRVASKMLKKLEGKRRIGSRELVAWKTKIAIDNQSYIDFLSSFSEDAGQTDELIEQETSAMLEMLKKIDPGVSSDDANLLASARWIRLNTKYEPLIVTDDSDLLTCAHILSSFFGLTLGFLSSFEILRLVELDEPFTKCCSYFGLSDKLAGFEHEWPKSDLEDEISNALRKTRLACHPSPHAMGAKALKIIRR